MIDRRTFLKMPALAALPSLQVDGLQAAIDALGSTGGVVDLPPGVVTLSRRDTRATDPHCGYCLNITAAHGPITLRGNGTTLRLADGEPSETAILLIDGQTESTKRTAPTRIEGIRFEGGAQPAWGDFGLMTAMYADDVTIEGCTLSGAPKWGIHSLRNSRRTTVRNCRADSPNGAAIVVEAPGARVQDNTLTAPDTSYQGAISLAYNADIGQAEERILITGNTITGGGRQMTLGGARSVIVSGNMFLDTPNPNARSLVIESFVSSLGTYLPSDILVSNNLFQSVRVAVVLNNASRCTIQGNHINGAWRGVWSYNGASQNVIAGNAQWNVVEPIV